MSRGRLTDADHPLGEVLGKQRCHYTHLGYLTGYVTTLINSKTGKGRSRRSETLVDLEARFTLTEATRKGRRNTSDSTGKDNHAAIGI